MTASPEALKGVLYIKYSIQFQAQQVEALINSGSEVNAMTPTFVANLGLSTQPTNDGAQKIDDSSLKTYGMTIAGFSIQDRLGKI